MQCIIINNPHIYNINMCTYSIHKIYNLNLTVLIRSNLKFLIVSIVAGHKVAGYFEECIKNDLDS